MRKALGILLALTVVVSWGCVCQESTEVIQQRVANAEHLATGDAVILLDKAHVIVADDGSLDSTMHEQILLLSWEAIDYYGQVVLPYLEGRENFTLLYAQSILEDGNVVMLDESGIIRTSYSEGGGEEAFADIAMLTLQMPSLRPGVVIDYAYRIEQQSPDLENEFYDYWFFEWDDPVLQSEYTLDVPADFEFAWHATGIVLEPVIQTAPDRVRYGFMTSDIAPLAYEIGMPSVAAVESNLVISSIETWEDISKWWWNLANVQWELTPELVSLAEGLVAGAETEEDAITRIFDYVSRQIRYVSLGLGTSGYEPRSAQETLATQYGDCKDQTVLMIALLAAIDIEAIPALMDAADGANVDWARPPSPRAFDHVVVAISTDDGAWRYLDPTCALCATTSTDGFISGKHVLLALEHPLAASAQGIVPQSDPQDHLVRCTLEGVLTDEDALELKAHVETHGDNDMGMRDLVSYYRPAERENLFAAIVDFSWPQATLDQFTTSDLSDLYTPFTYDVQYQKRGAVRWITGSTGLLPLPYAAAIPLPADYSELVISQSRQHPLLTPCERIELHASIELGAHHVDELPPNVLLENEIGSFQANYRLEGKILSYERALVIYVNQVPADLYPLYREVILAMLEDAEAMAVLKRE